MATPKVMAKMPQIEDIKVDSNKENSTSIANTKPKVRRKSSIRTPKALLASNSAEIIKPSPMTTVLQRFQQTKAPTKHYASLAGPFKNQKLVEFTLRKLKYEIAPSVSKETSCVVYGDDSDSEKIKQAEEFGIPVVSESELFSKPDDESDTESEEESEEDDELILEIDDSEEDLLDDMDNNEQRLKDTQIAFVGKFETPFLEMKEMALEHGGSITAVESLQKPATHIVLSDEYGTPKEFLIEYSSYWWIRRCVFLSEIDFLNICDGLADLPRKKLPKKTKSVRQSMNELSIDNDNSVCTKRKERPPTTPKKSVSEVKPLFSFTSPERKKGRIGGNEEFEKISSFKFTSVTNTPASKPIPFAKSKYTLPKSSTEPKVSANSTELEIELQPQPKIKTHAQPQAKKAPTQTQAKPTTMNDNQFHWTASHLQNQLITAQPVLPRPFSSVPNVSVMTFNEQEKQLPVVTSTKFAGKIFVLVGKFKGGKKVITGLIQQNSGTIPKSSHLSLRVSYLVCGEGAASTQKYKKAQEKNIPIITEEEFMKLVQE